jgi:hypothetical protein
MIMAKMQISRVDCSPALCCIVQKKKDENRMLQEYVSNILDVSEVFASVVYQCCKSRSGCCTCCNGYTRIIQVYVLNISCVLDVCCKSRFGCCIYMHVASICFKCF